MNQLEQKYSKFDNYRKNLSDKRKNHVNQVKLLDNNNYQGLCELEINYKKNDQLFYKTIKINRDNLIDTLNKFRSKGFLIYSSNNQENVSNFDNLETNFNHPEYNNLVNNFRREAYSNSFNQKHKKKFT
jgi:hypothetical protein